MKKVPDAWKHADTDAVFWDKNLPALDELFKLMKQRTDVDQEQFVQEEMSVLVSDGGLSPFEAIRWRISAISTTSTWW